MATNKIAIRTDTAANWSAENPILEVGEQGHETDTGKRKIGDGATAWGSLGYIPVMIHRSGDYYRSPRWLAKSNTSRTTIAPPLLMEAEINGTVYRASGLADIDISQASAWDTTSGTDYTIASNRAGVDFYIYACEPSSGDTPSIILSANATIPDGYTAENSRKIGGFHCLSADIGSNGADSDGDVALWPLDEAYESYSITGNTHWLNGYTAGDILPFSVWDLLHRPASGPEGMTYDPWSNLWVDIYLASWTGSAMQSANGGTIADGGSSPHFHWHNFAELLGQQRKRLPFQHEFQALAFGCPQGVNISGSSDPGTTGGHTATDGHRIISNIGVEGVAGVIWQWGADAGATNDQGSTWEPADTQDTTWAYTSSANPEGDTGSYDHIHGIRRGGHYEAPNRPRFGGDWGTGARCGSRAAGWDNRALLLNSTLGARGVTETKGLTLRLAVHTRPKGRIQDGGAPRLVASPNAGECIFL